MSTTMKRVMARLLIGLTLLLSGIFGQSVRAVGIVTSLTLNPSTVAGGTGGTSTATVTLSEPAPVGGSVLTISSSITALAASVPSITVPAGASTATFIVATNALYRQYSGLGFSVVITVTDASTTSTKSATLTVTAQPRPPDILGPDSDMSGLICGGALPDNAVLLSCVKGPNSFTPGPCSFVQECTLGCQDLADQGTTLNAACATTSPFPVSLTPTITVGGGSVNGTSRLPQPAPANSHGYVQSFSPFATASSPTNFSFATDATTSGFTLSTQAVGVPTFVAIDAANVVPEPASGGGTFFAARTGLAWLTLSPPANAPHPRLTSVTLNPASMQECSGSSQGTVTLSPAPAGAVQVLLGSDRPDIVDIPNQMPSSVIVPAGATRANFTVSAPEVTATTTVDISAKLTGVTVTAPLTITDSSGPGLSTITLNPSTVVGGQTTTGTVMLNGAAGPGGVVVSLFSYAPVTVPPSVTVPAGQTSAIFTISTAPVTFGTVVGVTAAVGCVAQMASLMVTTGPADPIPASLVVSPSTVVGGTSTQGTVTLNAAAPAGGAVVSLSDNSTAASVPGTVTVAAGATSATFSITTSAVSANQTATISASLNGVTTTATCTITPPGTAPSLSSLVLNPTSVSGGNTAQGTVTLTAAPAANTTVSLASGNTSVATVPATVIVNAGSSSAPFVITSKTVTANQTATISASLGSVTKAATLTVTPASAVSLASLSLNPTSVKGGDDSQGTVTLTVSPSVDTSVGLSSSNTSRATVPTIVTVKAGFKSATFSIKTNRVSTTTTVSITATQGGVTKTSALTLTSGR
jgi:hypothetical protein